MTMPAARSMVFLHSSDELYGADRILLDMLDALPPSTSAQVWLPVDLPHGSTPLCEELERRGHRVRHLDLPVLRRAYRTPVALARLVLRTLGLARQLRTTRPDVVYCVTSATYLGVLGARWAGVRHVVGHVQELWTPSDTRILARLAARCDRLVAISRAVADALPDRLGERTTVVLNSTPDPGTHTPLTGRTGELRYVVASRWNGWKGHRTLLAAWDRAGCPGHLSVLGAAPPSGTAVDVVELVAGLARPDSVTIVGEVPDPAPHLDAADVVLMPSDDPEPFGLVAVEAFARGRPVMASAAGGLVEIVTDDHDGWLFPCRDVAALTTLLQQATRSRVEVAGAAARRTYEDRFTLDRFARQWCEAVLPTR